MHKDELFTSDSIARKSPKLLEIKEMAHTKESIRAFRASLAGVLRRRLPTSTDSDSDDDDGPLMASHKYDSYFENH